MSVTALRYGGCRGVRTRGCLDCGHSEAVAVRDGIDCSEYQDPLSCAFVCQPPPFDDVVAVEIPPHRQALFPGAQNGSAFPASFEGAFKLNKGLRSATKLFVGEVLGSGRAMYVWWLGR